MSETVDKKNLLTSKEVNRAWLLWLFNNQACYNYERMMGIGFLHAMTPAFRKLYKDNKDLRIEAMQRHTSFNSLTSIVSIPNSSQNAYSVSFNRNVLTVITS